ncbi:MAG TPA: hypothetical protein VMV90_04460 [Rectinemataceae bacterium]|nr:hypothetical protein [Rectinemataceae bacterium]
MDFSDRELKVVLQALYRFRGEVSGFSQTEQNKLGLVEDVIGKLEGKVGPVKAEKTRFDREMEESLAVLSTGRAGTAKAAAAAKKAPAAPKPANGADKAAPKRASKLDKSAAAPKVKGGAAPKGSKAAASTMKKPAGPAKAGAAKTKSR